MKYYANFEEDAVIREDENGECFAKLYSIGERKLTPEYKLGKNSEMRYGSPDYMNIPYKITREEYDTFGVTWLFGETSGSKVKI
jgi:hypothetical protein